MQKKTKNKASFILPQKPTPRTIITQSDSKKWKGCIYFSSYDSTGQILLLLKSISTDYNGKFLKNPLFVFTSKNKTEVETQMTNQLQSLLKRN
jgi:hypothetical protein